MKINHLKIQDTAFMNLALNLSKKNIGLTKGNPSVGCILVKNETIIATAVTCENGVPHAENIAILKAGKEAARATLYVTLEPCAHHGKTPPCADLIIKAKIARVVIAAIDPDSRVNKQGIKKLQDAGIEVVVGVLEEDAKKINCGFFSARTLGRPFITLKLATSADEKIFSDEVRWISSKKFQQYSHYYRLRNDAILVGSNTVKKDDPSLTCRLNGCEKYSPARIILSSKLDFSLESKLIKTADKIPTYIASNNPDVKKFTDLGIKIINFSNLEDLLQKLTNIGINNLLIEGGGQTARNFLEAGLIDRFLWLKSPKILGEKAVHALAGKEKIFDFINKYGLKENYSKVIEGDVLTEFCSSR